MADLEKDMHTPLPERLIEKIYDLSTRMDERVKNVQANQDVLSKRIDDVLHQHISLMQKIAVLEARNLDGNDIYVQVDSVGKEMTDLDKRLTFLENEQGKHSERWKGIASFVVQLIWVILASYVLMKLNLTSPQVP